MYKTLIIVLFMFAVQIQAEQCTTPNNEKAQCMPWYLCPALIKALGSKQNRSTEFVRKSSCGYTGSDPMVCCGTSSNFVVPSESKENETQRNTIMSKLKLLPTRRKCGLQHSDDYVSRGNFVEITEFPWLARIVQEIDGDSRAFGCLGSLINSRYVLTSAYCVVDRLFIPIEVNLGEYHTANDTDCVENSQFTECSEPVEVFGIEKTLPHPKYNRETYTDNIALIRLNRTASYSDYVRPICLPLPPKTMFAKVEDTLFTSGWGFNQKYQLAETKKKVASKLISNEECAREFRNHESIRINENHMCSNQLSNNTELGCWGDDGGPVMVSHRAQWHQEGIMSFIADCPKKLPDVHTRVVKYLTWILENLEP